VLIYISILLHPDNNDITSHKNRTNKIYAVLKVIII